MKAIVYENYGAPEVLHIKDVEKPTPAKGEILVRVHASTVNSGDLYARDFKSITSKKFNMPWLFWFLAKVFFGFRKPKIKILGAEFSGTVEALGTDVQRFKPGDSVFGYLGQNFGSYGEFVIVPENGLVALKPKNMDFMEAAAIPYGAVMALNILKLAKIQRGQKVLINGASGGIGSVALQLAKHYGAEVTGVCSTARVGYVKSLGADRVIDYTQEDFTQKGETYDLILDILGRSSFSRCKNSLNPQGLYLLVSFKMKQVFQALWTSFFSRKKILCALANEGLGDMERIKDLAESGVIKSIVDRTFSMEQAAEAHLYAEEGKRTGNIVIQIKEF